MALIDLDDPRNEILQQKLDRHYCVEFQSDSDGDGFNFPKPRLNPQNAPLVPPKMALFSFGLEQKLNRHSCVEFHSDSDGDGFNFPKAPNKPPKMPPWCPQKWYFSTLD